MKTQLYDYDSDRKVPSFDGNKVSSYKRLIGEYIKPIQFYFETLN